MAASLGCFFVIELIMKTIVVVLKHVFKAIFKCLLSAYISIASSEETEIGHFLIFQVLGGVSRGCTYSERFYFKCKTHHYYRCNIQLFYHENLLRYCKKTPYVYCYCYLKVLTMIPYFKFHFCPHLTIFLHIQRPTLILTYIPKHSCRNKIVSASEPNSYSLH